MNSHEALAYQAPTVTTLGTVVEYTQHNPISAEARAISLSLSC